MKEWARNLSHYLFANRFRLADVVANSDNRDRAGSSSD